MQQYLYKYLLLHHKLSIPALGNFMVEFQPAHYNESTGLLFPRKPVIDFNEGPAPASDKNLIHFLSAEMGMEEEAARKEFQNFSIKLLVNMVEQHFIDLHGIGRIKKEMNGNIIFLPASNLIDILPPLRLGDKIKLGNAAAKEDAKERKAASPVIPQESKEARKTIAGGEPIKHLTEKETAELLSIIRDERKPVKSTGKLVEMTRITTEEATTKDRWWLYAAILAGLGIVALLVKLV